MELVEAYFVPARRATKQDPTNVLEVNRITHVQLLDNFSQVRLFDEARFVLVKELEQGHDLLLGVAQVQRLSNQLEEKVEVYPIITFTVSDFVK